MSTMTESKVEHVVDEGYDGPMSAEKAIATVLDNTRDAALRETQLGVVEAFKLAPNTMMWSLLFSMAVIMVGYDGQIIYSFFNEPAFVARYGISVDGAPKAITAPWQVALGMGNPIGQILGSLAISWPCEHWGRKKVMIACNIVIIGFVFMQTFAPSIQVLCAGEILAGLVWGSLVVLSPTYASEVSLQAQRGVLTAFTNEAFVIGQLIGSGVIAGLQNVPGNKSYKVPFLLQLLWAVILLIGIPFAPESPWFLVRKGRREEARGVLQRLGWDRAVDVDEALVLIEQTDLLERELNDGSSYWDCFKKNNLRRTEICSMVYANQVICGNPLIGYSVNFMIYGGLSTDKSFDTSVGITAAGFVASALVWVLMSYAGRRTIYNTGLYIMTAILFIIGIIDCSPSYTKNQNIAWAEGGLLIVWTFLYQLTIGPLTFVIISEVSSTKLRSRTIAVATAVQSVCTIVTTVAVPYMMNPANGNFRGKIGFFFGGLSLLCSIWCYFRLPETKGRTFEELDIIFERQIKAKDFKAYNVFDN